MSSDTIKSKSVAVELGDGKTVDVRRMKWKAAREFLKKFSAVAVQFLPKPGEKKEGDQPFNFISVLPQVINHSDDLMAHILKSSTELKPEEIDNLDSLDALKILGAAFDVNYDDELKNFLAGTVAKLAVHTSARAEMTTS